MSEQPSTSANAFRTAPRRTWWQRFLDLFRRRERPDGLDLEAVLAQRIYAASSERVIRRAFVLGADREHASVIPQHLLAALLLDTEVQAALVGVDLRPLTTEVFEQLDHLLKLPRQNECYADLRLVTLLNGLAAMNDPRRALTATKMLAFWLRTAPALHDRFTAHGFDELRFLATFAAPLEHEPAGVDDAVVVVRMHNDDFTTTEFVTAALREVCGIGEDEAVSTMYAIHDRQSAIVWRGSREGALDVVARIEGAARDERQPLRLTIDRDTGPITSSDRARPSS